MELIKINQLGILYAGNTNLPYLYVSKLLKD